MSEVPNELDWVTVHAGCSISAVFETLRQQVESDVAICQAKYAPDSGRMFKFVSSNPNTFAVIVEENAGMWVTNNTVGRVAFNMKNNAIHVTGVGAVFERGTPAPALEATTTVNGDGQCRMKVEGKELTFWQLRKMALETLFFGA